MASPSRIVVLIAAMATLGIAPPPRRAPVDPVLAASLEALAAKDLRVATVAYRLQRAAVPHCGRRTRLSGLVVQDASQYRADLRPAVAALFGLADLPTVMSVVPGSAGARAGIRSGDAIVALDGHRLAAGLPDDRQWKPDGSRYSTLIGRLDAAFSKGPVVLTVRRGGVDRRVRVPGEEACASIVQLDLSDARNAGADGHLVTISQGVLDFTRNDDELAFVIGHELAHNILGHRDFLDSTHTRRGARSGWGGNGARLRRTESEADYWGVYLTAWAGYDPYAAAAFWRRMAHADWLGDIFSDGTHPGNGARVRGLERAAAEIDLKRVMGRPLMPDYKAFSARREH